MTLVVAGDAGALVAATSSQEAAIAEPPTYRLVDVPSPYDVTHATPWFYHSRALAIQKKWRAHRSKKIIAAQRVLVQQQRQSRADAYYASRMVRLLHYIAWDGDVAEFAAIKLQRWIRWRLRTSHDARRKRYIAQIEEIRISQLEPLYGS